MQEIYIENIKEVIRAKNLLQKKLNIKLANKGKNIFIEGTPEYEYLALHVLEAIDTGFSADTALELKTEGMMLQIIHIKDITKRNDLERVRARIIGSKGKTLSTLKKLTNCSISLKNNKIGLIGDTEIIDDAVQAVTSLIQGSKQGNVYSRLERESKKKRLIRDENIKNELS